MRATFNPDDDWSFQASYGFIKSPEQLEPNVDQRRTRVSATYNRKFDNGNWQTTLAWGRNDLDPGRTLDALLLESAVSFYQHTLFARAEDVAKDELFLPGSPLQGREFRVAKLSLGHFYDIPVGEHASLGLGGLVSFFDLPQGLSHAYGVSPMSYMLFTRLKLK